MSSKTAIASGMAELHSLDVVNIQIEARELAARLAAVPSTTKLLWRSCGMFPNLRQLSLMALAVGEFDDLRGKLESLTARASSIADCSWGADAEHIAILERYIAALSVQLSSFERTGVKYKNAKVQNQSYSVQWFPFRDGSPRSFVSALERELDKHWQSYMVVIFDELLQGREDPLLKCAEALGTSAIVNSVAMYPQLVEQFPILREEVNQNWDFVLAVAGIFMAATELSQVQLGEQRKHKLLAAIGRSLSQLPNGDGDEAFRNCETFVQRYLKVAQERYPHEASKNHAIGLWAVWNVLDRGPANPEEFKLIRATGALIHKQYSNWWSNLSDNVVLAAALPTIS